MVAAPKKVLFYGGAFNPPHRGHEFLFSSALNEIEPDVALVLPSSVSPHKPTDGAGFYDRAAMCRCFLRAGDNVKISLIENRGAKKRSYTVNTVHWLQKRYPSAALFMLIGGDMLTSFTEWKSYKRLLADVTIVASRRAESEQKAVLAAKAALEREGARIILLDVAPVEVSSSYLRAQIAAGADVSAYLSADVADYIETHKLYR